MTLDKPLSVEDCECDITMTRNVEQVPEEITDLSELGVEEVIIITLDEPDEEVRVVEAVDLHKGMDEPVMFEREREALACSRQELIIQQGAGPKLLTYRNAILAGYEIGSHNMCRVVRKPNQLIPTNPLQRNVC